MIKEVMDVEIRQEELLLASQRVHPSGRITYLALLWSRQLCILTVWSMARFYKGPLKLKRREECAASRDISVAEMRNSGPLVCAVPGGGGSVLRCHFRISPRGRDQNFCSNSPSTPPQRQPTDIPYTYA